MWIIELLFKKITEEYKYKKWMISWLLLSLFLGTKGQLNVLVVAEECWVISFKNSVRGSIFFFTGTI